MTPAAAPGGLTVSEKAAQPRWSGHELFAALDLSRPGLEAVQTAAEGGRWTAAKRALLAYMRQRRGPRYAFNWWQRRPGFPQRADIERAEKVCQHIFIGFAIGAYPEHRLGRRVDWAASPFGDREWAWCLNRHFYWKTLGQAYWDTDNEKYAREFVNQMTDWVRRCPPVTDGTHNASATWRTIEAGIRMGMTWPAAYQYFLHSPSLTGNAHAMMLASMVDHARHLAQSPTGNNWLIMECNGLAHVGVLFPEFREAEEWRGIAYQRLEEELTRQVYPDGCQVELSTAYHQVCIVNFSLAYELARRNGLSVSREYLKRLETLYEASMYLLKPNLWHPALSDADVYYERKRPEGRQLVEPAGALKLGAKMFGRPDFRYVATQGKRGRPPAQTSRAFPWAGYYVMRSGYVPTARYLVFDAGPYGAAHQHEDMLSFEAHAYGDTVIVDPGRHAYAMTPWRAYFLTTASHNTALVDGQGQNRAGQPPGERRWLADGPHDGNWHSDNRCDYVTGTYDQGYGLDRDRTVSHHRHVLFVKPDYWVVFDCFEGEGEHTIETLFHFPPVPAELGPDGRVTTRSRSRANVCVAPAALDGVEVRIVSGQHDPIQGWVSPLYNVAEPAPVAIYRFRGALPAAFGYVVYPLPRGRRDQIEVEVLPVERPAGACKRAVAMRVVTPGRRDVVLMSHGVRGEITFARRRVGRRWALFSRRSKAG